MNRTAALSGSGIRFNRQCFLLGMTAMHRLKDGQCVLVNARYWQRLCQNVWPVIGQNPTSTVCLDMLAVGTLLPVSRLGNSIDVERNLNFLKNKTK